MSANSKTQGPARIPELDGIRGLAISLVLFEHYVGLSIPWTAWHAVFWHRLCAFGASGVDLFFVLSGFLIGGILMDQREGENYFKSFYARRCCRILPPYFLLLISYLVVRWLLAAHVPAEWYKLLFLQGHMPFWANLTFTQNFVQVATQRYNPNWLIVTWSLVVEEQFYLVLPLVIWLLRPSLVVKIFLAVVFLNPVFQLYLCISNPVSYMVADGLITVRADALPIGVICAYAVRQNWFRLWVAQNPASLKQIFVVLLLGMVWIMAVYDASSLEYERIIFFKLWVALFYAGLLLVSVTGPNGIVSGMMRFPPLRQLGMISYGVYLFHQPINGLLHGLLLGRDYWFHEPVDVLVTAGSLAVTLAVTTLSWRFVEKPIVAWGHSFLYGRHDRSTGS
jgi:peptidoglycan/LPS O-acetylase OafA/YrhL